MLMQVEQRGERRPTGVVWFNNGFDPIRWRETTLEERTRILDREHQAGNTPGADGWLVTVRDVTGLPHPQLTRIRWEMR